MEHHPGPLRQEVALLQPMAPEDMHLTSQVWCKEGAAVCLSVQKDSNAGAKGHSTALYGIAPKPPALLHSFFSL